MIRPTPVNRRRGRAHLSAAAALSLVAIATLAGIVGTALIFTAVTDHEAGALAWGLPLALGGLYWCGRALGQSQRPARRRRLMRQRG